MFYKSSRSRRHVLHARECRYFPSISPGNLVRIRSVNKALASGYRLCSCCNLLKQMFQNEEDALQEFSRQHNMRYELRENALEVWTPFSRWQIVPFEHKPGTVLYHWNGSASSAAKNAPERLLPDYHCQNVTYSALLQYFEYIESHDGYRIGHPPKSRTPKAPPKVGTKRYRKMVAKDRRIAKKKAVRHVLKLIDSISS